jgi:hypothetical protein
MSKAVVPLRRWREREGTTQDARIEPRLRELFTAAILGDADGADGRAMRTG